MPLKKKLRKERVILSIPFFPFIAAWLLLDALMIDLVARMDSGGNAWAKSMGMKRQSFFEYLIYNLKNNAFNFYYHWWIDMEGKRSYLTPDDFANMVVRKDD